MLIIFIFSFFAIFMKYMPLNVHFMAIIYLIESIKIVGMEHFTVTDGNWEHRTFLGFRQ